MLKLDSGLVKLDYGMVREGIFENVTLTSFFLNFICFEPENHLLLDSFQTYNSWADYK